VIAALAGDLAVRDTSPCGGRPTAGGV